MSLNKNDFKSNQEIRWCPGCGDYAILAAVQKCCAELEIPKEDYAFVSGIGCSSRFPYYMNCYGFHTIHGRAASIATGLKITNPKLNVWVISGDGDSFSIGTNHFFHVCRRNVDLTYLIFNNRIYGLTKGQYSPTSEQGKITKSTPMGSLDFTANPLSLAFSAGATFVARAIDKDIGYMAKIFKEANLHKGTSIVEVYQNCNIFNDNAFDHYTNKKIKSNNIVLVEDGKPLIYGENLDKVVSIDKNLEVKSLKLDEVNKEDLFIHDSRQNSKIARYIFSEMTLREDLPTPFGVFYREEKETYENLMDRQVSEAKGKKSVLGIQELLRGNRSWQRG